MNALNFLDFNNALPQTVAPPSTGLARQDVLARVQEHLVPLLQMLFAHGKRRGHEFVIGNLQGAPGDSLSIALDGPRAGMWIDHATGECGDLFALWAAVKGNMKFLLKNCLY